MYIYMKFYINILPYSTNYYLCIQNQQHNVSRCIRASNKKTVLLTSSCPVLVDADVDMSSPVTGIYSR